MPEKFDVIVVGAGLSGLSAAYTMAQQNMKVLVIERGDHTGTKSAMGGVIYRQPVADVFPDFWRTAAKAPLERPVIEQQLWVLTEDSSIKTAHRSGEWGHEPYNAFTVMHAKFDSWLGERVTAAGGLIIPSTLVTDLLRDGRGHVIGVRTDRSDGDLLTDIVILADGATSLLGEQIGLHPRWQPTQLALAVRQILAPSGDPRERRQQIEQRFALNPGEGTTIELFGALTHGMVGTAFLLTNAETLTLGLQALLSDFGQFHENPYALLHQAKGHPALAPLLADCETLEYSAHLIPAANTHELPTLVGDGVMLVGDAAQLCSPFRRRGSQFAMLSGKLAAETALAAHTAGDFSQKTLRSYQQQLLHSPITDELAENRKIIADLAKRRHFLRKYPETMNAWLTESLTIDGTSQQDKRRRLSKIMGNKFKIALDLWHVLKVTKLK